MADDLKGFNSRQVEAILHKNGPCLVLAGPGSGKTTVITRRLQNMIRQYGISPQGILVVTFTKAAAAEMQLRFNTLMGETMPVSFGTFHAIFFRILREHEKDNPPELIKEYEKKAIIEGILKRHSLRKKALGFLNEAFSCIRNGKSFSKELLSEIDEKQIEPLFKEYRIICAQRNVIDFDDMAFEVKKLFMENPAILKIWQKRFEYILIDEYQDISPVQEDVVSLLCKEHNNIFVVGDDDQAIYGFRGAGTNLMLTFPERYRGCVTINLDTNYRSRPDITKASLKVIEENKNRYDKIQRSSRENPAGTKNCVYINAYKTREEQYEWIVEKLKELGSGGELSRTAVIYRKNSDAAYLTGILDGRKIPYVKTKKEQNIFNHFITEDITAYLKYLNGDNTRSNFYRIMNRPERNINREALGDPKKVMLKDIAIYHKNEENVINAVIKLSKDRKRAYPMSIYAKIMYIRKQIGYEAFLEKEFKGSALDENLQVLDILQGMGRDCSDLKSWENLINERDHKGRGVLNAKASDEDEPGVKIMTYHASKGLEFDHVLLPDLNEGTVPHRKALSDEECEEERRMFYVAMTRAREDLYLMYTEGTKLEPVMPSRFLKPLT